jgi:hypothetical protein
MGRRVHSETPHSFANSGKGTASSPLGSGMRGRGLPFGRGGRPGFRLLRWVAPRVSTRDGVGVSGHVSGSNFLSPVALAAPARGDARSLVNGLTEQAATLLTARGAPPDTGVVNGLTEKTRCAINAPGVADGVRALAGGHIGIGRRPTSRANGHPILKPCLSG